MKTSNDQTLLAETSKAGRLQAATIEKVELLLSKASHQFERRFAYTDIRFDLRGRAAGQVVYDRYKGRIVSPVLRFNMIMLGKYDQHFIEEVVPHECAHLVAYELFGSRIKPHGREWKMILGDVFDCVPRVTHQFEVVKARSLSYFEYVCHCKEKKHTLSSIRHNKIVKGRTIYRCRECGESLAPVDA